MARPKTMAKATTLRMTQEESDILDQLIEDEKRRILGDSSLTPFDKDDQISRLTQSNMLRRLIRNAGVK